MYGFYVEMNEYGQETTVFTVESSCGDFPECHDELNPCNCNKPE
jgi:hypothetical protein